MFGRLDFMERRGSGFKKILEDYRFEENFSVNKTPVFRSDPYSFSVTLYNLNYGVDDDNVGNADGEMAVNGGEMAVNGCDLTERLILHLKEHPKASAASISKDLHIPQRTIERRISELKNSRVLIRHGAARGGYWEVMDEGIRQ